MSNAQAKLKTKKIEAGRYKVSVNGVPCLELYLSLDDGYTKWIMTNENPACGWTSCENTKRDCIDGIWRIIDYDGIDHVLANYSN